MMKRILFMLLALVALAGCGTAGAAMVPLADPAGLAQMLGTGIDMAQEEEVVVGITYAWERDSGYVANGGGVLVGTLDSWVWGKCRWVKPSDPAEKPYLDCDPIATFKRQGVTP